MLTKETNHREFDIAVLGATGYVGRRLLSELEKLSKSSGLRLLATARSLQKIQQLRASYPSVAFDVLDVLDSLAVEKAIKRTQLVVSCIGPFDLYGENVVRACAATGTHYLDITGEIHFARRMIELYDDLAKRNNAMIIPFAGFDSVPSDAGVFLVGQEMHDCHAQSVASVDIVFKIKGGINGGTAASALNIGKKTQKRDEEDYNFLAPEEPEIEYKELYRPRYIGYLHKWVAPFFMEAINNKVIYRSLALAHKDSKYFTPGFRYRESIHVPGGWFGAMVTVATLKGFQTLLKTSSGRRIASLILPKSGEGPSEKQMRDGFFEATVIATGSEGKILVRKMTSNGDPGNVSTVKLLIACIRAMMTDGFKPKGGLLTPSSALGVRLLPALRESGVSWIV